MRYLVDSDWAINYLRGIRNYVQRIRSMTADGIGLSIISLAEIYEGVYRSTDPSASEAGLLSFLSLVEVLALDDETCRIFGQERGRLRARGALIGDMDILIGATALRHNLTLLTNNQRHFERIPNLPIISA